MNTEMIVERLFEALVNGDRAAARSLVQSTTDAGIPAPKLLQDIFWPIHEMLERLQRSHQIELVSYHLATRLLRTLVDQAASRLAIPANRTKTLLAFCGPSQGEELGAQIAVDLLEAAGFDVVFGGGGVPSDEIMAQVHSRQPDILLMFASAASDLPAIRTLVDNLRGIGASTGTRLVVGGGVFARAEGLADEIGIEVCAASPEEMVEMLSQPLPAKRATAENDSAKARASKPKARRAA
jgi:methanogenic corrinoid protein MtbC1